MIYASRTLVFLMAAAHCIYMFSAQAEGETIHVEIANGAEDVEEQLGGDNVGFDSSDLELGTQILPFNLGAFRQSVGLRFLDIGIPQGSTISKASIKFTVADEVSDVDTSLRIYGELTPDSAPYMDVGGNVADRASTSSVLWDDIPAWTIEGASGPDQQTPDLAAIVQEIVDQPGWATGNAMSFVINPEPIDNDTGFRTAVAFESAIDNRNLHAPILNIEFAPIPEPSSFLLFTLSMLGLRTLNERRRRR